ncbi:MAG: tryptophan synthase subunit alpha [Chloroflexia bacterium]|nr:tryptophan synthase subunit alpha [Chloroflexia bacterium]
MFARCRAEGRTALGPFVTAGYPSMEICERLIPAIVEGGADFLEIGVPFSDPLADGTTVQRTSQKALENGTRLKHCIALARTVRERHGVEIPLLLMGYYNPILRYGIERFVVDSAAAGVDGFIVPDLPAEESDDLLAACRMHGRDLIFLLAPTSTERRIEDVASRGSGFIYCVSLIGVTGARDQLATGLASYLEHIRAHTTLPLAVGFGISTPAHVREVGEHAEGVIVASALINYLDTLPEAEQPAGATQFVRYLRGEGELEG